MASLILVVSAAFSQTSGAANDRLIAADTMHKTILGFESSCRKWGSTSLADIAKARAVWEQKHAAVLAAAAGVLANGTAQQRAKLDAGIDAQNLEMEQKVESAPNEERARWCSDFPSRIASETMNPDNLPAYKKLMN